jgi:glycosyltransferase involved in cell wall biosynthesis
MEETAVPRGRIALFLPKVEDGGAENVMLQLGASFRARGHDVDLVVGVPGGPLEFKIPRAVRVVDLAAPRTLHALPALIRYLRRERPRALLSTLEHSNILATWGGRLALARTRIVLREARVLLPREQRGAWRTEALYLAMRGFYRAANAVVAVSKSVADSLRNDLGLPSHRIHTIYNPVVTDDLPEKAAAPLDDPWFAPGAPPVVLGVGRLVAQKDFGTLIRAFAKVRTQRAARLVILGEGADRGALERLAHELGVAPDVRLPGFEKNPFRYMQRATVFALSSLLEGLPGVLIQAMACGCRVASTDSPGGSREILDGGALGPLVAPGDWQALAAGIGGLLDDASRTPARPSYPLARFSERTTVDEYLRVLGVGPN